MSELNMSEFDKDASQACDYCSAKNALHRAARPDPSRDRKRPAQDDKLIEGSGL
jgi:hypothetical protein